MSEQILHVWGFIDDRNEDTEPRPTGVQVATYDGPLADVVNGVLDKVKVHHPNVTVRTTRDLSGWLKEVHAYIDVNGTPMWHLFTTASEQWPMATGTD